MKWKTFKRGAGRVASTIGAGASGTKGGRMAIKRNVNKIDRQTRYHVASGAHRVLSDKKVQKGLAGAAGTAAAGLATAAGQPHLAPVAAAAASYGTHRLANAGARYAGRESDKIKYQMDKRKLARGEKITPAKNTGGPVSDAIGDYANYKTDNWRRQSEAANARTQKRLGQKYTTKPYAP